MRLLLATALGAFLVTSGGCFNTTRLREDVAGMQDPVFPDERRQGIAGLQWRPEGKQEEYKAQFRQIAVTDSSPLVRAQAVRALNQARDPGAEPIYLTAIRETKPAVQLEGAKALRHAPDERAIGRLTELASNDQNNRDVRVWAARALGAYPRLDVARTLVALLETKDFSVSFEARSSLRFMTGKDFHYDTSLWLNWLTRPAGGSFASSGPTSRPW